MIPVCGMRPWCADAALPAQRCQQPGPAALLAALLLGSLPALAQVAPPAGSVRMMVGFPPSGATDALARTLSQRLAAQTGATVYVENRPGANGNIAAEIVARAAPDGQTLLFQTSSLMLSRAFGEKPGFDLFTDLAPVALVATSPQVLYVHPAVPSGSSVEFIAHLRANPDKLAYGSSGAGSITHLSAVLFLQTNGLQALHVPYKGSPQVMVDLLAGRIQFTMQGLTSGQALVRERKLRAVAVSGLKRMTAMPEVPTLAEGAMPGFEVGVWYGVMAPGRTPGQAVRRLNADINRALQDPALLARFVQENAEPLNASADEFSGYLKSEVERWTRVIKAANIQPL